MEFRILGPVEAVQGDRPVKLGGPKQKAVLALLLTRRDRVVSTDQLIDDLWGEQPPKGAKNALQSYVSRLRGALGPDSIEGRSPGYAFHVDPEEIDAFRFEELIEDALPLLDTNPKAARSKLEEALGLWRGRPFADVPVGPTLLAEITRLEEMRLDAEEGRIAALLELGGHREVIDDLERLTKEHPFRESLWAHLMVALYRSGRQADALGTYRRLENLLREELGFDPSPDLQRLELRILQQDPSLEPGTSALRGYRLIEQIGEGHFGVVYRARQPHVERDVAIKLIRPLFANRADFVRRFEAEAQIVAGLEHPNIVPLYDYWRDPGGAYLVMRWMRGGSVRGLIGRKGVIEPADALEIMQQVASGLDAAHRRGVVHRDLKPANLLLDEESNVYLSDFGLAVDSLVDPEEMPGGIGTYGYLSPEQIRNEPPTPRADVYALGVLLYELFTGHHPYSGSSPEDLRQKHLEEPIPSIAASRPELDSQLDEIIQRATAKAPEDRYEGPFAMVSDLRARIERESPSSFPAVPLRNPYRGLRPFEEADAPYFFGRHAMVARLVARLVDREGGLGLLAVVGPSGSGKSSLVRAGLVPALRSGVVPGSEDWLVAVMHPGSHPFVELEAALSRVASRDTMGLGEQVEAHPDQLPPALNEILPEESRLVLVIDQFEELFTMVEEERIRIAFLDALLAEMESRDSRLQTVVVLRADFYDRPLLYPRFGQVLADHTEAVTPLSLEELEQVMVGPAEQVGAPVEPSLAGHMAAEVASQPGALPLLQYALTEMFDHGDQHELSWAAYHAVGGVSKALARRAEDLFQQLDTGGREACRQLFLRLVSAEDFREDIRRRVLRVELTSLEVDETAMEKVVVAFGRHRLLSFDRDPLTRGPTVEVAHEALLREWGRLRGWLDGARADLRMRRSLRGLAAEWEQGGRDPSFLMRGNRIGQFDSWRRGSGLALTRPEREYLEASLEAQAAEEAEERSRQEREAVLERRSIRRLQALVGVLVAGVVLAGGLSVFAFDQRGRAQREARLAMARELASAAEANLDVDPDLAINLALRAVETTHDPDGIVVREAEEVLHAAVQASRVVIRLPGLRGVAYSPDGRLIATTPESGVALHDAHSGRVVLRLDAEGPAHLSWSAEGDLLAVAGRGPLVSLYDTTSGELILTMVSETGPVEPVAFSPDGKLLAGLTLGGNALIWDTNTGQELARVPAGGGWGLGFSPDSQMLAVPVGSGTALYHIPSGDQVQEVPGDGRNAVFDPTGKMLATTGLNGVASIWDLNTNERVWSLVGHDGHVNALTFSPDGLLVATGANDGTARLWDVTTGEQILMIGGQLASVDHLAFSPDGSLLASGGSTGTLVWDVTPTANREVMTIAAHSDDFADITYSPDGSQIASAGFDGIATIWDAESGARIVDLATHASPVTDIVYNKQGTMLATSSFDHTAKLWDASGAELRTLTGHTGPVWAVSFSPDGSLLTTVAEDETGRVWDVATGDNIVVYRGHTDAVYDAAWSPDGTLVVSVSNDFTARAWDPFTGEEIQVFQGHEENIVEQAFSLDGTRVATAGFDGVARVWDVSTGESQMVLSGHSGIVLDVEATPDGTRWVTTSLDGSVRFWDGDTGREVLTLHSSLAPAGRLALSPDGERLAAATSSGLVSIYTLNIDELIEIAQNRVTRPLTHAECSQYLHTDGCSSE